MEDTHADVLHDSRAKLTILAAFTMIVTSYMLSEDGTKRHDRGREPRYRSDETQQKKKQKRQKQRKASKMLINLGHKPKHALHLRPVSPMSAICTCGLGLASRHLSSHPRLVQKSMGISTDSHASALS